MEDIKQKVTELMNNYNIGKKPLSRLLGWGDTTIMNQVNGGNASREYADRIRELAENPCLFSELLENNKKVLTPVAYRKAREAVNARLFKDKSSHILMFLLKYTNNDVAPYQLVATLFYSQVYSLLMNGRPLIDEDVFYRPRLSIPYPGIYSKLVTNSIVPLKNGSELVSPEDKELVTGVYKVLNGFSPNAVKAVLKKDKAGLAHMKNIDEEVTEEGISVSLSALLAYFTAETRNLEIEGPADLIKYFDKKLSKKH